MTPTFVPLLLGTSELILLVLSALRALKRFTTHFGTLWGDGHRSTTGGHQLGRSGSASCAPQAPQGRGNWLWGK